MCMSLNDLTLGAHKKLKGLQSGPEEAPIGDGQAHQSRLSIMERKERLEKALDDM